MDTKETLLSYIKENLNILDKYDLENIKEKVNKSLISEKLHVYHDEPDLFGRVCNGNNVFDLSLDFKENERRFKLWANQNFGSIKTFQDYYHCKNLFKWYFFRPKETNYYSSNMNFGIFFHVMYFFIDNEKHDNLAEGNELADKYTQSYKNVWKGCHIDELGIYVKFYKNGRIDIKGLTEEQQTMIEYFYELSRKRIKLPNRDY